MDCAAYRGAEGRLTGCQLALYGTVLRRATYSRIPSTKERGRPANGWARRSVLRHYRRRIHSQCLSCLYYDSMKKVHLVLCRWTRSKAASITTLARGSFCGPSLVWFQSLRFDAPVSTILRMANGRGILDNREKVGLFGSSRFHLFSFTFLSFGVGELFYSLTM